LKTRTTNAPGRKAGFTLIELLTDASVKFVKNPAVWKLVGAGQPQNTTELDNICNLIELNP